jgi:hypothetical protein
MCRSILDGNPYIDEVWEIPLKNYDEMKGYGRNSKGSAG